MTLLDLPIPPKPAAFTPEGAPPGVEVDYDSQWAFKSDGITPDKSRRYWQSRPKIKTRVAIVHTNAAQGEGTTQSAINWGNIKASNTHPTYAVNWPKCVKLLPSDRRSVANSTEDWYEKQENQSDASFWTLSIETADTGTKADPAISDFLTVSKYGPIEVRHDEIVARILAYESIVWGFPLEAPKEWDGTGVAAHTFPFPHPAYTIQEGKTCPGPKKSKALFDRILPRARQIRAAWLAPVITPPMEDDMPEFVKVATDPTKPADPGTLFAVQGLLAWHVSPSQYGAAGIPFAGRTLTRAECSKYTFVGNVPNGYHGIWAQDGHQ